MKWMHIDRNRTIMSAALVLALVACGAACGAGVEDDALPAQYGCAAEGDPCARDGYTQAGNYDGTCHLTASGAGWVCCGGCWDAARFFCEAGTVAPMCGAEGEACSPSKCP